MPTPADLLSLDSSQPDGAICLIGCDSLEIEPQFVSSYWDSVYNMNNIITYVHICIM